MSNFNIVEYVQQQESFFMPALTDNKMTWAKESQFAIQALDNNEYLSKIAIANPVALQNALINVAAIGISLNPAEKLAYLVPRKGKVCLDISYMGLIDLAQQVGAIEWCQAKIVYEKDIYARHGIDKAPQHDYSPFASSDSRGLPVGAYVVVKLASGDYLTEEMSQEDIEAIRNRSEAWKSGRSCPWKTDPLEMWKKTVVKKAAKYWPKNQRLDQAIHYSNVEGGEGLAHLYSNNNKAVNEPKVVLNPIESIKEMLTQVGKSEAEFLAWASKVVNFEVKTFHDLTPEQLQKFAAKLENAKQ